MTTIVRPHWAAFTQTGPAGLTPAFLDAALNVAGFAGHGIPLDGAPFALLNCAAFYGLDGDRPAWVVGDFSGGNSPLFSPGWDDQGGLFNPLSPSFSEGAEITCYLNGVTGAWWIAENGVMKILGTRIKRFSTDLAEGVFSRYMIVLFDGANIATRALLHFGAPYSSDTHRSAASLITNGFQFFSPLGPLGVFGTWFSNARLAQTMAPTLAPVFPMFTDGGPPIYAGECLDMMVATDGFDPQAVPGWMLWKSDAAGVQPYIAVPAPYF